MGGRDKDCATRVSSLANEEPLVVVEAGVDIMREVVGKNCGDSRGSVIREGEAPLRRSGCGGVYKGTFGTEDRDISCDWGVGGHWGLEIFATGGSDKDVVRVDGDVFVERGKEESVEDVLSNLGGSGRHRR